MVDYIYIDDARGNKNMVYILFPLAEKGSLRQHLNNRLSSGLPSADFMRIMKDFRDICDAVNVLHLYNPAYAHQDIKPDVREMQPCTVFTS